MINPTIRPSGRQNTEIRNIDIKTNYIKNADGSCLISFGNTSVICAATIDKNIPTWLKNNNSGWLTAEYSMLPNSTHKRKEREGHKGTISGRTQEIQRLIGRSLRSAIDLKKLGENQILIDCDVINADGGTRTAAITGGWIALKLAINYYLKNNILKSDPMIDQIAALSSGIYKGTEIVDLDYIEDSNADTDANFVITKSNKLIEVQATAEKKAFNNLQINKLMRMTTKSVKSLFLTQDECLKNEK